MRVRIRGLLRQTLCIRSAEELRAGWCAPLTLRNDHCGRCEALSVLGHSEYLRQSVKGSSHEAQDVAYPDRTHSVKPVWNVSLGRLPDGLQAG